MSLSLEQLLRFLPAAFLITAAPGPDILATLSLGLSRGWRAAVGFGVGCGTGCLLHTALAVLGVSALLQASPMAFGALRLAGAGYLVWIGWGALRSGGHLQLPQVAEPEKSGLAESVRQEAFGGWSWFARGLLANAVNPKVALFFLSFLPQFVDDRIAGRAQQLAVLGVLFTLNAVLVFSAVGFFSGRLGVFLQGNVGLSRWLDRLTGLLFWGLAVRLVIVQG